MKFLLVLSIVLIALLLFLVYCIWMPGNTFSKTLPESTPAQRELAAALRKHVEKLSITLGPRGLSHPLYRAPLMKTLEYLNVSLSDLGYSARQQEFAVGALQAFNLEAEIRGSDKADEIIVIGAHYDSCVDTPGANDNASGVAALLELARSFAKNKSSRTVRFVAFANEEPPYFQTKQMGSWVYAQACRQKNENIVAMISLETMGYYSAKPGTQKYPFPFNLFYPSTGNFIAFVGNLDSRALTHRCILRFRQSVQFPSEGVAAPERIPGIGWSDHWSFWQFGYPALMVTDTAYFRDPAYHRDFDSPNRLDYDALARVTEGVFAILLDLANS